MNKYLLIILLVLGLASCNTKNEHYYLTHPKALQAALKECPAHPPKTLTCQQIRSIGEKMNILAYELQRDPQAFGIKILNLQNAIALQNKQIKTNDPEQQEILAKNNHKLAEYLAIVKWLESPEN